MSTNTTNYNLVKPANTDMADLTLYVSNNLDTIDTTLFNKLDKAGGTLTGPITMPDNALINWGAGTTTARGIGSTMVLGAGTTTTTGIIYIRPQGNAGVTNQVTINNTSLDAPVLSEGGTLVSTKYMGKAGGTFTGAVTATDITATGTVNATTLQKGGKNVPINVLGVGGFWTGGQAAYTALGTYDPTTVYFIVGA